MSVESNWLEFFEDRERLHADYYLDFAQQHARRDPEAYEQLEAESGNLLKIVTWLSEQNEAESILQLAEALWQKSDFVRTRGFLQRVLPLLEQAHQAARQLEDSRAEFAWLEALADIHLSTGNPTTAQPLFEHALSLAQENGDLLLLARSQLDLGRFFMEMGLFEDASSRLKEALHNHRQIQDYEGQVETLIALGNLFSIQGITNDAIAYIKQGLRLTQIHQDLSREVALRFALGYVGTATQEWAMAIKYYEPVIEMARTVGNRFLEVRALHNMGEAWLELDDVQQAMACLDKAVNRQKDIDDALTKAFTHLYLAKAYNILNSPDESLAHLKHVNPLSQVPVLFAEAAEAAWIKADNYLKKGNTHLALPALQEVLDLAPEDMLDLRQAAEMLLQSLAVMNRTP